MRLALLILFAASVASAQTAADSVFLLPGGVDNDVLMQSYSNRMTVKRLANASTALPDTVNVRIICVQTAESTAYASYPHNRSVGMLATDPVNLYSSRSLWSSYEGSLSSVHRYYNELSGGTVVVNATLMNTVAGNGRPNWVTIPASKVGGGFFATLLNVMNYLDSLGMIGPPDPNLVISLIVARNTTFKWGTPSTDVGAADYFVNGKTFGLIIENEYWSYYYTSGDNKNDGHSPLTQAHEFGHAHFKWPDISTIESGTPVIRSHFDLMGDFQGGGTKGIPPNPFLCVGEGWADLRYVTKDSTSLRIAAQTSPQIVYILPQSPDLQFPDNINKTDINWADTNRADTYTIPEYQDKFIALLTVKNGTNYDYATSAGGKMLAFVLANHTASVGGSTPRIQVTPFVGGIYANGAWNVSNPGLSYWPSGGGNSNFKQPIWPDGDSLAIQLRHIRAGSGDTSYVDTVSVLPHSLTFRASNILTTSAQLHGYAYMLGWSGSSKFFIRDSANTFLDSIASDESPLSSDAYTNATYSGLTLNKRYYYKHVSIASNGYRSIAAEKTFRTPSSSAATVTTDTAITGYNIHTSSSYVNLYGHVNPNNIGSTTVRFLIGHSAGSYFDSTVAVQSPLSGSSNQLVTCVFNNLTPSTVYYFRVRAYNGFVPAQGVEKSFTSAAVPSGPPTIVTGAATGISDTRATLNGSVNPQGAATTFRFYWGTSRNTLSSTAIIDVTDDQSYDRAEQRNLSGLTASTAYYFAAYGSNSNGSASGDTVSFFTSSGVSAPTVTTAPASPITSTSTILHCLVNPNGGSTLVTFDWSTSSTAYDHSVNASEGEISGTLDQWTSVPVNGLTPATIYYFRARATNGAGTTNGSQLQFTTLAAPPTATTSNASSVTQTTATLNGVVNPGGASTTVRFVWGTSSGAYDDSSVADQSPVTGNANASVSVGLTGLSAGVKYYFRVRAYSSAGTAQGGEVSFTTQSATAAAPKATALNATLIGSSTATLNGIIDANGATTEVWFLWKNVSNLGGNYDSVQAPSVTGNNIASEKGISGLDPANTYSFLIHARNSEGQSVSDELLFTTLSTSSPLTKILLIK